MTTGVHGLPDPAGGWAAAAPSGGDSAYRAQSLRFMPIELTLDESVSWQALFGLWLRAFVASLLVFAIFGFFGIIALVASLGSSSNDSYGSSSSRGGSGFTIIGIGYFLSFIVFWVVLLLSRADEPVAEWRTLVEDKAAAADSSYAAIFAALRGRFIPVGIQARRVRSDVFSREVVSNRLTITERSYIAYVSVFSYGSSLYVGWMMWRSRRGLTLIGVFIKDLFGSLLGRTGAVNQMLRTEKVRAMREAVHSAVREGVDAAVRGTTVSIAATFGHELPIEDMAVAAPPVPLPAG